MDQLLEWARDAKLPVTVITQNNAAFQRGVAVTSLLGHLRRISAYDHTAIDLDRLLDLRELIQGETAQISRIPLTWSLVWTLLRAKLGGYKKVEITVLRTDVEKVRAR